MCHDWPVTNAIVNLPIRFEGKFKKRISGNLSNPLGAQNKDIVTASQTLLTGVRLHLQGRLIRYMKEGKHVIMLHSSCEE